MNKFKWEDLEPVFIGLLIGFNIAFLLKEGFVITPIISIMFLILLFKFRLDRVSEGRD